MTQPYTGAFNPGRVPSSGEYLDPTTAAPVEACQAAVDAAIASAQQRASVVLSVPNMATPGTHAGSLSVDAGGQDSDS